MAKTQSVTSLAPSPLDERKARMIKYSVAMGVRVVCIILAMFVQGWLMWVCFAGAIFLPYFAVIIANAQGDSVTKDSTVKAVAPTIALTADSFREAPSEKVS